MLVIKKNINEVIKEDENARNNILEELEKNMYAHNNRIKQYENKMKDLDILKMKYANLERESKDAYVKQEKRIKEQQQLIDELLKENQSLKKTILTYQNKENSLKSIVSLMVNDFGIDQVALACGLSTDKIEEYLEKK